MGCTGNKKRYLFFLSKTNYLIIEYSSTYFLTGSAEITYSIHYCIFIQYNILKVVLEFSISLVNGIFLLIIFDRVTCFVGYACCLLTS